MDKVRERIKSWQNLGDLFLKENKKVYIKDYSDNFYFGELLYVGESTLEIECFAPEQKAGQKFVLYWYSIDKFEEYRDEVKA
jgi:hypothetical protein